MKCIVLAAGYATRLFPLTENFPKPLLEVNGMSILDHLLRDIDKLETIDGHIIVSNHRYYEHFVEWAEKNTAVKKPVTVLDDGSTSNDNRLGAVKDIQFAIERMNIDEDVLIIAGDNLIDFSFGEFVDFAEAHNSSAVMVNYEESLKELRRCGVMVPDENMKIVSMEEKPQNPKSNWCVGPFYYYRREDLPYVAKGIAEGCGTDAPGSFVCYLCEHTPVYAYEMPGHRYDIGDLESYKKVQETYNYNPE